jgi:hypothetical protein
VSPDREEAAIGATPEVVVDEMSDVTGRLGDRLWMIAPMTAGVVASDSLPPVMPIAPEAPVSSQE